MSLKGSSGTRLGISGVAQVTGGTDPAPAGLENCPKAAAKKAAPCVFTVSWGKHRHS